ncbi:SEC-C domain-containing protein [Enterococcus faecalis]|uniref:YecA family protein n=1 Tax=Enterococcus faecalis TaxID=1351 RepID=UPI0018836793|nr:SEC-C domain-containing protein [Enterococcus faecalis]EGO2833747.1 SEC-C domain-containing protein [Enterococcus faecalis]EHL0042358.1 SEC-C domain-containing protein [Enterococcus faecalis]MBE9920637.1 SEC-C domain-containing protein [Enterococcus faecalis]
MNPYTTKPYVFPPYESCPCESGKKYKFCCFAKSKNITNNQNYNAKRLYSEAHKHFRDTDFKTCFGFDTNCNYGYIGAHSLQNNGVLNLIADENHVYMLEMNFQENSLTPKLEFKKVGKKQASVFNGFCKYHDEEYFKIIEDVPFEGKAEQNYWFAFRAHCFEAHRKYRLKKNYSSFFKRSPEATRNKQISNNYRGNELSIRDMEVDYNRFKSIFESRDFDRLENFVKVLPFKTAFTATTAIAVCVDIEGKATVDIYNYDESIYVPSIYLSVIPKETETIIIVSRFKEDECYENFIKSLASCKDDEKLFSFLTFCLAEYSENVYFSPTLIDKMLTLSEKELISTAFLGCISPNQELRFKSMISTFTLDLFKYRL